jgi:hypothetical protein
VFDEITKVSDVIEICEVMRPIVVEQVEEVEEVEEAVVEQVVEEAVEVEDSKTIVNLQLLNFKKMTIKDLREHIINNQLTDIDISKLKKNELLKLCE